MVYMCVPHIYPKLSKVICVDLQEGYVEMYSAETKNSKIDRIRTTQDLRGNPKIGKTTGINIPLYEQRIQGRKEQVTTLYSKQSIPT